MYLDFPRPPTRDVEWVAPPPIDWCTPYLSTTIWVKVGQVRLTNGGESFGLGLRLMCTVFESARSATCDLWSHCRRHTRKGEQVGFTQDARMNHDILQRD